MLKFIRERSKTCFSKFSIWAHRHLLGMELKCSFDSVYRGWGQRICISNKLSSEADFIRHSIMLHTECQDGTGEDPALIGLLLDILFQIPRSASSMGSSYVPGIGRWWLSVVSIVLCPGLGNWSIIFLLGYISNNPSFWRLEMFFPLWWLIQLKREWTLCCWCLCEGQSKYLFIELKEMIENKFSGGYLQPRASLKHPLHIE